jgi:hypothetical protein
MEGAYLMGYVQIFQPGEYAICDECDKPKPLDTGLELRAAWAALIAE